MFTNPFFSTPTSNISSVTKKKQKKYQQGRKTLRDFYNPRKVKDIAEGKRDAKRNAIKNYPYFSCKYDRFLTTITFWPPDFINCTDLGNRSQGVYLKDGTGPSCHEQNSIRYCNNCTIDQTYSAFLTSNLFLFGYCLQFRAIQGILTIEMWKI